MKKPVPAVMTAAAEPRRSTLPLPQMRRAVADLLVPRPAVYWLDLLGSIFCFYACFAATAVTALGNPVKYLAGAIAVLALYRALVFIHELVHLRPGQLRGFSTVWNLCCGIPLLVPSFLYGPHLDHHRPSAYGTADDGEYRPWGRPGGRRAIVVFALSSFLALPGGIIRFGLLGPASWISRPLRGWVVAHASAMVVGWHHRRPPPSPAELRRWRRHEAAAFAYIVGLGGLLAYGVLDAAVVLQFYMIFSAVVLLNGLRALGAHRYGSAGGMLSPTGQLLDTLNYPRRSWIIPLWAPVGLRFHALHHLFPGIPYHNLPEAHRRLTNLLPPSSPYHLTEQQGLRHGLAELWRHAERWTIVGNQSAPVDADHVGEEAARPTRREIAAPIGI